MDSVPRVQYPGFDMSANDFSKYADGKFPRGSTVLTKSNEKMTSIPSLSSVGPRNVDTPIYTVVGPRNDGTCYIMVKDGDGCLKDIPIFDLKLIEKASTIDPRPAPRTHWDFESMTREERAALNEEMSSIDKVLENLRRRIASLDQDISKLSLRLSNPLFVNRAPEDVVQKTRDDLERLSTSRDDASAKLQYLEGASSSPH